MKEHVNDTTNFSINLLLVLLSWKNITAPESGNVQTRISWKKNLRRKSLWSGMFFFFILFFCIAGDNVFWLRCVKKDRIPHRQEKDRHHQRHQSMIYLFRREMWFDKPTGISSVSKDARSRGGCPEASEGIDSSFHNPRCTLTHPGSTFLFDSLLSHKNRIRISTKLFLAKLFSEYLPVSGYIVLFFYFVQIIYVNKLLLLIVLVVW